MQISVHHKDGHELSFSIGAIIAFRGGIVKVEAVVVDFAAPFMV